MNTGMRKAPGKGALAKAMPLTLTLTRTRPNLSYTNYTLHLAPSRGRATRIRRVVIGPKRVCFPAEFSSSNGIVLDGTKELSIPEVRQDIPVATTIGSSHQPSVSYCIGYRLGDARQGRFGVGVAVRVGVTAVVLALFSLSRGFSVPSEESLE